MDRVAPRDSPELRSAYCHGSIEGALPCLGCGTWVHPECRAEVGRCPTAGCVGALAEATERHLGWVTNEPPPDVAPEPQAPSVNLLAGALQVAALAAVFMLLAALLTRLLLPSAPSWESLKARGHQV